MEATLSIYIKAALLFVRNDNTSSYTLKLPLNTDKELHLRLMTWRHEELQLDIL